MEINGQEVEVEQLKDDWAMALMSKGIVVKLSVNMWRGSIPLTPEELGLKYIDEDMTRFAKEYIHLGSKKILPPTILKQLTTVSYHARNNLAQHSFDTVWGKFVPFTAFNRWHEIHEKHRRDFLDIAQGISANYDEIVLAVKNDYKTMARDVWARLYPDDTAGSTESFQEDFITKVISKIPPREDMMKAFGLNVTYLSIPIPTIVQRNLQKASDMEHKRRLKDYETQLEMDTKKKIADEYIKRKHELIDGFLESTVYSMREHISDLCDAVLESIGKRSDKSLTKMHVKRIDSLINNVNALNFYDDEEIKELMSDLRLEVDKFKGERNDDIIVSKLKKLVDVTSKELTPDDFSAMQYLEI